MINLLELLLKNYLLVASSLIVAIHIHKYLVESYAKPVIDFLSEKSELRKRLESLKNKLYQLLLSHKLTELTIDDIIDDNKRKQLVLVAGIQVIEISIDNLLSAYAHALWLRDKMHRSILVLIVFSMVIVIVGHHALNYGNTIYALVAVVATALAFLVLNSIIEHTIIVKRAKKHLYELTEKTTEDEMLEYIWKHYGELILLRDVLNGRR